MNVIVVTPPSLAEAARHSQGRPDGRKARTTLNRHPAQIIRTMDQTGLGATIRSWRDRLTPADVGLPPGRTRRAAGLRREELAELAGVSVDYVVRLEQGR